MLPDTQGKIKNLRFYQEHTTEPRLNPKIEKKNRCKEVKPTMVDFEVTNIKQAAVVKQYRMNGQNDWWTIRLKPIQVEYYSVENQKS